MINIATKIAQASGEIVVESWRVVEAKGRKEDRKRKEKSRDLIDSPSCLDPWQSTQSNDPEMLPRCTSQLSFAHFNGFRLQPVLRLPRSIIPWLQASNLAIPRYLMYKVSIILPRQAFFDNHLHHLRILIHSSHIQRLFFAVTLGIYAYGSKLPHIQSHAFVFLSVQPFPNLSVTFPTLYTVSPAFSNSSVVSFTCS